jgi:ferredoxin--NADP+ reductase
LTGESPIRVAVIGAGPAGFYTAAALFKQDEVDVRVDMFNRLPTPYGLVREGVAPDHESIKAVTRVFDKTGNDPRFRFFGNISIGDDLPVAELQRFYHMVVYAVGAQSDRRLGIEGEDLAGSHPATIFVGWYNGHPDFADLEFDLSHERAVVIGNGNVAVDVARILVRSVDELAETDMADHALAALQQSRVREVVMLGRRGPAQAKFTSAELKEFGELPGVNVRVDAAQLVLDETSQALVDEERRVRRNLEILEGFAGREPSGAPRTIELRFLASPAEILGTDGRVEAVRIERNRLETGADGWQRATGTGEFEILECGLVLRSVGYRGAAVPGVPFDEKRGVIPNEQGRVTDRPGGAILPGEYAVGWIKRGPSGIIGTNKPDAVETVRNMLDDVGALDRSSVSADAEAVVRVLDERGLRYVTFDDWKRIDAEERARGEPHGRPRSKIVRVDEMLGVCGR